VKHALVDDRIPYMGYLKSHHAGKQEAPLFIKRSSSRRSSSHTIGMIFLEILKKREVQIWQYI